MGTDLLHYALDGEKDAADSEGGVDHHDEVVEGKSHLPAKLVEGPAGIICTLIWVCAHHH